MKCLVHLSIALSFFIGFLGTSKVHAQTIIHVGITQAPPINISLDTSTTHCIAGPPVLLNAMITGGNPGYTFLWAPSSGLSDTSIATPLANPTATTTYTLTVFDMQGCSTFDTIAVIDELCIGIKDNINEEKFTIFPNPGNGKFNIVFNTAIETTIIISISNSIGEVIQSTNIETGSSAISTIIDLSGKEAGFYTLSVKTKKGVLNSKLIIN